VAVTVALGGVVEEVDARFVWVGAGLRGGAGVGWMARGAAARGGSMLWALGLAALGR
jgi:hypothetical protein